MSMIRPELERLPSRLQALPLDERGYPVPWFVAWHEGKPEFRAMDAAKWVKAVRERRCWVCGDLLGKYLAFVIGPMCGINRTTSEPACHLECAEWSARNCPFLTRPRMVRRQDEEINNNALIEQSGGNAITRNPGVALVWVTTSFRVFDAGGRKRLITVGEPERLIWYAEGRKATREEVRASIDSGLPFLMDIARQQDRDEPGAGAETALIAMKSAFEARHYPELPAEGAR